MGTCKECRWWGSARIFAGDDEMHECLNRGLRAKPACELRDGFGKITDVATFADFGCNQFEGRT